MQIFLAIPILMMFLVVPPAFFCAGWYFGKAKKHGRFRKEYERAMFRVCAVLLTLILGGLYIWGFADALGHSSPYRSTGRQVMEIGFATLLFGFIYLVGLWFSHCSVVAVRRTFPKRSRLLTYFAVLLAGCLGPVGLGLLSLFGLREPKPDGNSFATATAAGIKNFLTK